MMMLVFYISITLIPILFPRTCKGELDAVFRIKVNIPTRELFLRIMIHSG